MTPEFASTADEDAPPGSPTVAAPRPWFRRGPLVAAVLGALSAIAAAAYLLGPAQTPQGLSGGVPTSGPQSAPSVVSTPSGSATGSPSPTPLAGNPVVATTAPDKITIVGQPPPVGGNPGPSAPARPKAPSSITATATSPTSVRLQWIDNAHDEIGFVLFRLGGAQVQLGPNTTSYEWVNLSASQHYCFAVGVYNSGGWASEPFPPPFVADWTCIDTPGLPPAAPSGLTAQPLNTTDILLRWTDNSTDESYFRILVADGQHRQISTHTQMGEVYGIKVDGTVEVGKEYCFQIQAVNSAGPSAWTPWTCVFSLPVPAIPADFTVTAINGSTVRLEWTDTSAIESVFRIYRTDRIPPAEAPANATSYEWTGLTPGTEYCFRMNAYNAAGYYTNTPRLCVTTPPA